jgi:hypothetical protein
MIDTTTRGTIVLLNKDLFFGVRLRQLATDLGFAVAIEKETAAFFARMTGLGDEASLGIVDIGIGVDWEVATRELAGSTVPVIAFGPHLDVDGLRSAKQAGVTRVFSNGDFSRETAAIMERYARPRTAS